MKVWATSHTCRSCDILPEPAHTLIVFLFCFCWFCFFWLNRSTVIIDAAKRSVNRASSSSNRDEYQLRILHLSTLCLPLSLSLNVFFFLFPWKLLAARLTTRAAVMTLDTRSRVDSALSTLAAFVAEPLGGTIGRALKKRRKKKRPRSCLRRNKSKIDFNSTIRTHWCFLFTGGPNRSCS